MRSSALGFFFFPYREIIGMPVLLSILSLIFSPASKSPLKPCSGPKIALILTPRFNKESTRCIFLSFLKKTELWFETIPIFLVSMNFI